MMIGVVCAKQEGFFAFTLIITTPNEVVAQAYYRMPAIILQDDWGRWLDPASDPSSLVEMLQSIPPIAMEGWKISPKVNNWRNDGPELLEPLQPPESEQMDLGI